ncbi:hypothetical protein ABHW52_05315 [Pediococcus pentosaceus]
MEVKQAIQKRHSVRHFTDQKIDSKQLKEMIGIAQKHLHGSIRNRKKFM